MTPLERKVPMKLDHLMIETNDKLFFLADKFELGCFLRCWYRSVPPCGVVAGGASRYSSGSNIFFSMRWRAVPSFLYAKLFSFPDAGLWIRSF